MDGAFSLRIYSRLQELLLDGGLGHHVAQRLYHALELAFALGLPRPAPQRLRHAGDRVLTPPPRPSPATRRAAARADRRSPSRPAGRAPPVGAPRPCAAPAVPAPHFRCRAPLPPAAPRLLIALALLPDLLVPFHEDRSVNLGAGTTVHRGDGWGRERFPGGRSCASLLPRGSFWIGCGDRRPIMDGRRSRRSFSARSSTGAGTSPLASERCVSQRCEAVVP